MVRCNGIVMLCASLAGLGVGGEALAHHGIANFDLNKDLTLSGEITELAFVNPHSWLYFSVVGADGKAAAWRCEMRGVTVLRRSGWSESMLEARHSSTRQGLARPH